ncbi:hypothetical protein CALCODRAFT_519722 [Calocera cornea HHB12733]|uniref:DUF6533 domain-containing protein n=1 Tax=Calocera cornea HHB12733 TaxID=1353952 RepID=A0A165E1X4_9BASI|nr:hypothetical protein CALCODRAFT_519722 [Calocera cornea HHB12733]
MAASDEVEQFLADIQRFQYVAIATTCAVVYDAAVTFPEELKYVWRRPVTLPRVMYASIRVLSLAILGTICYLTTRPISDLGCKLFTSILCHANIIMALPGDALMVWRVVALFHPRKRMGIVIWCLCGCHWLVEIMITVFSFDLSHIAPVEQPGIKVSGCWPTFSQDENSSILSLLMFPSALGLHAMFFVLTIFNPHTMTSPRAVLLSPLIRIIRREVAWYFVLCFVPQALSLAMTMIFAKRVPGMILGIVVLFGWQTIGPCRLYLHLKASQWDNISTTEWYPETGPMSDMLQPAEASSSWSSVASSRPSVRSRRRWMINSEQHAEVDPSIHQEVNEVVAILDEGVSGE